MRVRIAVLLTLAAALLWTPRGYQLRWRVVGAEAALGDLSLPAVVC